MGSDGKSRKIKSKHTDIRKVRKERAGVDLRPKEDESKQENKTLNEVAETYISTKTGKAMPDLEYKKYEIGLIRV